jgi:hypothetical protein
MQEELPESYDYVTFLILLSFRCLHLNRNAKLILLTVIESYMYMGRYAYPYAFYRQISKTVYNMMIILGVIIFKFCTDWMVVTKYF